MSPTAKSSRRAPDPDAVEIGELYRTATELRDAARVVDDALHVGEILPKKCRQAVTHADHCNWCDKPFAGSKRFVILDHDCGDVWSCFGLRSICFDCFKEGDPRDSHSGISAENRKTRQCNGCGEPISIPVPAPGHRWRSATRGALARLLNRGNEREAGAAPKILGRGLPAESRLPTGGTRAAEEAEVRHGGCAAPGSRAAAADHGRGERRALSGRGEKD
jgi:hypothetical protein